MTPKEKAKEMIEKYCQSIFGDQRFVNISLPMGCALICVDEILMVQNHYDERGEEINYWQQVKTEIQNL